MEVNKVYQDPRQALGPFRSPHCLGDETAVKANAPGAKWKVPLPELVTGFIEKVVGISPSDPERRHPKYLCSKVLLWQQPADAQKELIKHLKHVSVDKTRAIMNCFTEILRTEIEKVRREEEKKAKHQSDEQFLALASKLRTHLTIQGLSEDQVKELDIDGFIRQEIRGLSMGDTSSRKRSTAEGDEHDRLQKKKEVRRGEKSIDYKTGMKGQDAAGKLAFIVDSADEDTGSYDNPTRHWLMRVNRIDKCFRDCCGSDVATFLSRHGHKQKKGGGRDFAVTKLNEWPKMAGCAVCREEKEEK